MGIFTVRKWKETFVELLSPAKKYFLGKRRTCKIWQCEWWCCGWCSLSFKQNQPTQKATWTQMKNLIDLYCLHEVPNAKMWTYLQLLDKINKSKRRKSKIRLITCLLSCQQCFFFYLNTCDLEKNIYFWCQCYNRKEKKNDNTDENKVPAALSTPVINRKYAE